MKKLTIGSAVYDDFEGVYFTYQSLRLNTQDIKDELDLLIIDNNPDSAEGAAVKHFCEAARDIRYIPYTERRSTSVRNEIFKNSKAEFCMSIDPHVLFEPNTVHKLIEFFGDTKKSNDLYHGPMLYDVIEGHDPCSKMDPIWRDNMFGIWSYDKRGNSPDNDPFEIDMHGLGLFACRTKAWLGFNENFIGFGGEEGYIHKKFQQAGHKIWCLPFLRWVHRFQRPLGIKYPLITEERIKNYLIGHRELGLPLDDIINHFNTTQPQINIDNLIKTLDDPIETIETKEPADPPAEPKTKGAPIKLWSDSEIDFSSPSPLRYIKYKILNSYDGNGSLREVRIDPYLPQEASIHSFSSESPNHRASFILNNSPSGWLTDRSDAGKMPHEVIIDLGRATLVEKITTFARNGLTEGLPTEFKVYGGNDLIQWDELSHVDILSS